jgi:acetyltransferase
MPQYSPATLARLKSSFPAFADPSNPLDAWGLGWDPQRFADMVHALATDDSIGAIAFALDLPQQGGADTFLARDMLPIVERLAPSTGARFVWINNLTGGGYHAEMTKKIKLAGFPYLRGLRAALSVIGKWSAHEEVDLSPTSANAAAPSYCAAAIKRLAEPERFKLLSNAGIAMCPCIRVGSPAEAISAARDLGFPVVLKATSPECAHKTDLDLVRANLRDLDAIAAAFDELSSRLLNVPDGSNRGVLILQPMVGPGIELIIGVRNDESFGSIVVAGLGGIFIDVLHEAAVEIGPVTVGQARAMLERTHAGTILSGVRGRGSYDIDAACAAIAALSQLGHATRGLLSTIEINPLIVLPNGGGAVGVDVLIEEAAQVAGDPAQPPF